MNDFEKAKAFICDKNNSLPEASKKLGIPLPTLKAYRSEPEKLRTAAWNRVNEIASLYKNWRKTIVPRTDNFCTSICTSKS